MITLATPKGWTGPKMLDGLPVERLVESLRAKHRAYVDEHFEDLPEIRDWTWAA